MKRLEMRLWLADATSNLGELLGFSQDPDLAARVRQRVLALYEDGTYSSWAALGKALGVKRGTVYSIVYGYCNTPTDPGFLDRLETAEFKRLLPQAVETLRILRIEAKAHYERGELRRLRAKER